MSTPLVEPDRRITVGQVISSTFKILFRRFWAFLGFAAIPSAVTLVGLGILGGLVAAGIAVFRPQTAGDLTSGIAFVAILCVLLLGVVFVTTIMQYKCEIAATRMALDMAVGRTTSFAEAWRSTGNVLKRVSGLVLSIMAIVALLYGALLAWILLVFVPTLSGGDESARTSVILTFVLVMIVSLLVFSVAGLYFRTRLFYAIPAMSTEPTLGGFGALGRSWQISRGWFWPTLGYVALLSLVHAAVNMIASVFQQVGQVGLKLQTAGRSAGNFDLEQMKQLLGGLIGFFLFALLISVVLTMFAQCIQYTYQAMVYLARTRDHLPGQVYAYQGAPTQPGYGQPTYGQGVYGTGEQPPHAPTAPQHAPSGNGFDYGQTPPPGPAQGQPFNPQPPAGYDPATQPPVGYNPPQQPGGQQPPSGAQ